MDRDAFRAMAETEDRHWWFVGRRAIIRSLIRSQMPGSCELRILEAGCGTGGNLEMLREFGSVTAFEFDSAARNHAAATSNLDVLNGSLPDGIDHIPGPFDLICLFDVLEHIDADAATLETLASRLKSNGILFLTVPALQFLWSDHDELHHHKRRYSRRGLSELLRENGLAISYLSYFNSLLFPLAVVQRFASKLFGSDLGDPAAVPPAPINRMLTWIFAAEAKLLRYIQLPVGLSLCAIARRIEV